jgi:hypothetical protein
MPTPRPYHNVKIRAGGFQRLDRLVAALSQHGWAAVDIVRDERVSNLSVIDVALELLERRLKAKR